jgi:MoaA/NifB/PqqE/SkfB family radical SAM enzyme
MATDDGYFQVDPQGNLTVPAALAERFGLQPGARVRFDEGPGGLLLRRPVGHLARVYIEPTTQCNLACGTCLRQVWNEPLGRMSEAAFLRILEGLRAFRPAPLVFFGGYGEPLTHPEIFAMVREAKQLGAVVELITNGTLLDELASQAVLDSGLDCLWISVDGAADCGHAGAGAAAGLSGILDKVGRLQRRKSESGRKLPQIGLAFVAMAGNASDFPELLRWALRHRIKKLSVSNVLPHTAGLKEQILYQRCLYNIDYGVEVELPRLDIDESTLAIIQAVLREDAVPRFEEQVSQRRRDCCPFVQKSSASIRWDGAVSPCLPLLHTHDSYLGDRRRRIEAFAVGSLEERSLKELWEDSAYVSLRTRLLEFDFSPCSWCNSCDFPDSNREDCFGSPMPACGGCLWAQGFIRCP